MRAASPGVSTLPALEKRRDERSRLPDHDVVALLEAVRQDPAGAPEASEPIRGILLGVGVGIVLWLLLATAFVMAWAL